MTANTQPQSTIPPGYKQTEVGMIPEDWAVFKIADLAIKVGSGITPTGGSSVYKDAGRPFVRSQNVGWGAMRLDDLVYIDEYTHKSFVGTELQTCDVLLNITGASIGRSAIIEEQLCGGNVNQHVCIIRIPLDRCAAQYINCCLISELGQKQIDSFQAGGNREGLNFAQVRSINLPIPTLAEQEAIAGALSDADGWIESLEKLIEKKRAIKQGTLQALLTQPGQPGHQRLPGFKGEWEVKKLGETATLKARIGWQGLTTAEYKSEGDYYLVTGTEFDKGSIDWNSCHYVDERRYIQDRNIQVRQRDVLVTKDGTIGKVAYVSTLPRPATLNSGVFVIRPTNNAFESEFFFFLLCSSVFSDYLAQLSAGSTINHLYQKDFINFEYMLPPTTDEQSAIAAVLTDMDAEIEALEAKLSKARQIKQGMMQELLTGRVRLV